MQNPRRLKVSDTGQSEGPPNPFPAYPLPYPLLHFSPSDQSICPTTVRHLARVPRLGSLQHFNSKGLLPRDTLLGFCQHHSSHPTGRSLFTLYPPVHRTSARSRDAEFLLPSSNTPAKGKLLLGASKHTNSAGTQRKRPCKAEGNPESISPLQDLIFPFIKNRFFPHRIYPDWLPSLYFSKFLPTSFPFRIHLLSVSHQKTKTKNKNDRLLRQNNKI